MLQPMRILSDFKYGQFCRVIRGEEKPLVSGYEGLMTLKLTDAVKLAANSGELVRIER
jgi:hypothetical protein